MRHLADGWSILTLGHLFEIERGGSPRPIIDYITDEKDGINWIKIGDTKNKSKYIYSTAEKIKPSGMKKSRFVQEGDFLLSNSMSFGRPYILKTNGCIHDGWLVLRPKNKQVNNDYLYYILGSNYVKRQFEQNASGTTVKNLNIDIVKKTTIPLPPFEQQEKIGKVLDTASALVEKQKVLLKKYDLFLKSKFIEMFGDPVKNPMEWEVVKLKDLTSKIGSGATPTGGKEAYQDEGISLIRSLNVHDNQFLYKNLAFIDDKQADGLSNVVVAQNDVLLNITGASVCRTTIVPDNVLPARVNQHVAIIRPKSGILNSGYLLHLFLSNYKQHLIHLATSGGATREALTKADIEELDILLPPLQLQDQFSQIVEQTESLKQKEQQKLEKLQTLYDALMKQAFNGEII